MFWTSLFKKSLQLSFNNCKYTSKYFSTKIQVVSDVHLEHYETNEISLERWLKPSAPNLFIAGDLGSIENNPENYNLFLQQASKAFNQVFLVSGNHEYYNNSEYFIVKKATGKKPLNKNEIDAILKFTCNQYPNVKLLNNSSYKLNDVLILGTTLWSAIPNQIINPISVKRTYTLQEIGQMSEEKKREINRANLSFNIVSDEKRREINDKISDYHFIHNNDRLINTYTTDLWNTFNRIWLTGQLMRQENIIPNQKIIVLSHHLPSYKLIDPKYSTFPQHKLLNHVFANDLDYLMEWNSNIKFWICGHGHTVITNKINNCTMLMNPVGYKKDLNVNYKNDYVIEI